MISIFDIFKIGIGPSSSHTMAPMKAARDFLVELEAKGFLSVTHRIEIELFGALALTGKGHGTEMAILLGLMGETPEEVEVDKIPALIERVLSTGRLDLLGRHKTDFDVPTHLRFNMDANPHDFSSAMRFDAFDNNGRLLFHDIYYSLGGGFIIRASEYNDMKSTRDNASDIRTPHPFETAGELLETGRETGLAFHQIALANEGIWRDEKETIAGLDRLWSVMSSSIDCGCRRSGLLPGPIAFARRAPAMFRELKDAPANAPDADPLLPLDWINLYAIAVNEESASGGRVVTAPTLGSAGIIPAIGRYYLEFVPGASQAGIRRLLLTAFVIGVLYKKNASFAASEVGCQGEVGVACSMAAAGYVAAIGGSNAQIELAAETGMEHNLGLTCDPVGGYVQIPCIERNALGAVKAMDAARLAMRSDGAHYVSLDAVIKTMWETGRDMQEKYKDTGLGGLAANVPLC